MAIQRLQERKRYVCCAELLDENSEGLQVLDENSEGLQVLDENSEGLQVLVWKPKEKRL